MMRNASRLIGLSSLAATMVAQPLLAKGVPVVAGAHLSAAAKSPVKQVRCRLEKKPAGGMTLPNNECALRQRDERS
jgi:hypothetical protein